MCNPILGTLLSAVGSLSSAARQSGIAKAQAQIARNNALVERRRAQLEADQKRRIRKRTISAARANALARGIDDDGSVALSIMEEIGQSEHDIAVNRFGREAQARRPLHAPGPLARGCQLHAPVLDLGPFLRSTRQEESIVPT